MSIVGTGWHRLDGAQLLQVLLFHTWRNKKVAHNVPMRQDKDVPNLSQRITP
jgi:hypothetical protein